MIDNEKRGWKERLNSIYFICQKMTEEQLDKPAYGGRAHMIMILCKRIEEELDEKANKKENFQKIS